MRSDYDFRVGDHFFLINNQANTYETPYKVLFAITQTRTNGAVVLSMLETTDRVKIFFLKSHLTVNVFLLWLYIRYKLFTYFFFFLFLLVRSPRSQRLLVMVWCSSKTEHRRRRPLDSGPI